MSAPYGLDLSESCLRCKLRCAKFFCALPAASLASLEKIKFASLLPKGSTLFVAGQQPSGVYLVCAGKVKLCTRGKDRRTILIVKIAAGGELLGLHGCVTGAAHEFTAETVQPAQVVFFRRDDFLQFLRQDGQACMRAAQMLGRLCREAHEMLRSRRLKQPASRRLARLLLEVAASEGDRPGAVLDTGLSNKEIAQAIGMSRETVWRQVCDLRKSGIAILEGTILRIQDPAALKRLAGR
jgi:CRP-like cAMP-binding protein